MNILRWIGIGFGGLLSVIVLALVGVLTYGQTSFRPLLKDRPLYEIQADTSPEGIARGEYLIGSVMGCNGACHTPENGAALSGTVEYIQDGPISATFAVPNLTSHETGLGTWTDAEIARAIREGVDREGRVMVVMPSFNYHVMSDADVAAVVGYLRSLEPVENEIPPFDANLVAKAMLALGLMGPNVRLEPITAPQEAPQPGTVAYGGYLTSLAACRDCHGMELASGTNILGEEAPDLTPAGSLGGWTEEDFIRAIRTGVTPDGRSLSPKTMPWTEYGHMTDADLNDIFTYLQALPVANGK